MENSELKIPEFEPNRDGVAQSYVAWLEVKAPDHRAPFLRRLREDPEAARSEAVTFNILRMTASNPAIGEDVADGGVDFICQPHSGEKFAVEVTTLRVATVTEASRLPSPQDAPQAFSQITTALLGEAVNKARQMSGYPMARVLVLATEHDGTMLMGPMAAAELLTGTTAIRVRLGDIEPAPDVTTHLVNSVFFRPGKAGGIEPARQSISAILLVSVGWDRASVIGLLHPVPTYPFDPATLEGLHFVRLKSWPIKERFGIEWVGPPPTATPFLHLPIKFRDEEFRA